MLEKLLNIWKLTTNLSWWIKQTKKITVLTVHWLSACRKRCWYSPCIPTVSNLIYSNVVNYE